MRSSKKHILSLSDIQKESALILKRVADICENLNLRYVLAYGSLIGAVRHRGFIPWDDDIDIAMPRPDYERLLEYLDSVKEELLPLAVFNLKTSFKYHYGITRICDTRYEISTKNERDCGMGLFIDIYPIDGLGSNYDLAIERLEKNKYYIDRICIAIKNNLNFKWQRSIKQKMKYITKWLYFHIIGSRPFFQRLNQEIQGFPDFDQSVYVACAVWFFGSNEKAIWKRSYFNDLIKMQFGQYEYYVPKEFDELLRIIYGDYMQLPPIEERVPHHNYVAWEK